MPDANRKFVFDAKIDVEAGERAVVAVISTPALDRDREVLLPNGVDLKAYRKNPVVLWAHDYKQPPIGKALWIKKTKEDVRAKVQFADTDMGNEVFQLFQDSILKAFSVGFDPWSAESRDPAEADLKANPEWAGVDRIYTKWELLEFSAVPVPANPEALAVAVSKGAVSDSLAKACGADPDAIRAKAAKDAEGFTAPPDPKPKPKRRAVVQAQPRLMAPKERIRRVIVPIPIKFNLPTEEEVLDLVAAELDRLRGRV
jgi:phage head maturation protease